MRNGTWTRNALFGGMVVFVLASGLSALFSTVEAGACRCPLIYAPVTCDHGRTYPNQCEADCHNAKNCVPTGIGAAQ
jgi:hypothetical protein